MARMRQAEVRIDLHAADAQVVEIGGTWPTLGIVSDAVGVRLDPGHPATMDATSCRWLLRQLEAIERWSHDLYREVARYGAEVDAYQQSDAVPGAAAVTGDEG